MEDNVNWDKDIWDIIDSYFKNTDNYLSKHQIDSYNTFLDENIPKTIRQFNPIVLPYSRILNEKDEETDEFLFQVKITIGGSKDDDGNIINDGSSVFIGKPIIQEVKKTAESNELEIYRKTLYPNEARLKNITYKCGLKVDIYVEFFVRNDEGIMIRVDEKVKEFKGVQLTNNLPIMLKSKACSLAGIESASTRLMGECEYDQGGYFIIDGKEKVIVAQERQIENVTYINKSKPDDRTKYTSEIRSAPENKLQPARITKCFLLNNVESKKESIKENAIRFNIPNINNDIPIFIVFRALGVISDENICSLIIPNIDSSVGKKMLDILKPSVHEGSIINNQKDAITFLKSKISSNYMTKNTAALKQEYFLASILKDYLVPHVGTNYYKKAFFLGHMVNELITKTINNGNSTDRDSYMFKRVDISGFLMSAIFRDLYFRVKNKLSENLNIFYNTLDTQNSGNYWQRYANEDEADVAKRNYRLYNILSEVEDDNSGLLVSKLIDQSIMDEGFLYAFKNCWGLKNAKGCKQGVTQDMNRLSYLGAVSHIRRINTPLSKSAKVRAPHALHLSSFGIMCPDETPDGGNIGLRKNISIFANITSGTNSFHLLRLLSTSGLEDILQIDIDKLGSTRVFLNERLVGYTKKPHFMYKKLKLLKRNALINIYTSISWDIYNNIIRVSTDSGRGVRPVFVVKNNEIAIDKDTINKIKDKSDTFNWYHLVGGTKNTGELKPYNDVDGSYYIHPNENNLSELEKTAGIIEYIDPAESNQSLIAMYPRDLQNKNDKYNYCEIHPAINFGVLASVIPGIEMNQHPRNQFSTGQGKQALGVYATNFRNRMDTKGQIMFYPQKPIIKSKLAKYLRVDELPHGANVIVAVGCYSGFNQEDSIIFNKDSVERGMFKTTKFRTFSEREEVDGDVKKEFICRPTPERTTNLKSGNYNKLDDNGIIKSGVKVNENDVLIGKCVYTGEFDSNGDEIISDNSEFVKRNEEGFVDRVYSNLGNNNQRYVKVRIRKDKLPEVGDKFCSRHGQKGTIGMLLPSRDMPRTKNGITPDIIVNPHAFPSRMTIAQFFETILGKTCINKGYLSEIVPFSENNIENVANILQDSCGFEKHGNEVLYSGLTGEQLKVNFFIGPTYYLRLTHQVSDKYQARDDGLKTSLTHQPVGGRALGGGGRIGEMERDAILSHGISSFMKESYMERSDKYKFYISKKTGLISAVNPDKGIFRDISNDETEQFLDDNGNLIKRAIEETKSEFVCIEAPYSFKLFLQEVESMGIAPRLIAESVIKQWQHFNTKKQLIPTSAELTINQSEIELYNKSIKSSPLILPFTNLFNTIKLDLLSKSSSTKGQNNLLDMSCKNGSDLFKWEKNNINTVIAFDQEMSNIEGDNDMKGAQSSFIDMKGHDTSEIKRWALGSDINFFVGDIGKDIYSGEATRFSSPNYSKLLELKLRGKKNKFNLVSHFHGVEKIFSSRVNTDNFFSNVKNSLSPEGYLVLTLLDGNLIFNKLKESGNKLITGSMTNPKTKKAERLWEISTSNIDTAKARLSSSIEDGFKNTINLTFDSYNNEEMPIIHPSLLISMAVKHGLTLVKKDELLLKYSMFDKSTASFKNMLDKYLTNSSDKDIVRLRDSKLKALSDFADINKYFIFKLDPNKMIPNNVFKDASECIKKTEEIIHFNHRYPEIKLSMPIALDYKLINIYLSEQRALVGNMGKRTSVTTTNMSKEFNPIIENVESKLAHPFYREFSHTSFENTMKYIYEFVKIGVYVRIVNSQVVQFVPILNYNASEEHGLANKLSFSGASGAPKALGEQYNFAEALAAKSQQNAQGTILEFEDIHSFIDAKYKNSSIDEKHLTDTKSQEYEKGTVNETDYLIDGDNVIIGNNRLKLINDKANKIRYLLESVCDAKKDMLPDCEFIINLLDNPIVKIDGSGKLTNPFSNSLKTNAKVLDIETNILPILGETQINGFLDIPIPSLTEMSIVDDTITFGNCKSTRIEMPNTLLSSDPLVGFIIDMKSSIINEFIQKNKGLFVDIDIQTESFYIDTYVINSELSNIINNENLSWNDNSLVMNQILEQDGIDKFPVDSPIQFYIDGSGSNNILPLQCIAKGVLVILKTQENSSKPWYFQSFKKLSYVGGDDLSVRLDDEHYIEISDISNLGQISIYLSENNDIRDKLIKNKQNLVKKLFTKNTVLDYMHSVINKLGSKSSDKQVNTNTFKDIISEKITATSLHFPSELVGVLIGKNNSQKNKLENISGTKITISKDKLHADDGKTTQLVTITGGMSGVGIANSRILKLKDTVTKFIDIPKGSVGKLIGASGENIKLIKSGYNVSIVHVSKTSDIIQYMENEKEIDTADSEMVNQWIQKNNVYKVTGNNDIMEKCIETINGTANFRGGYGSTHRHIIKYIKAQIVDIGHKRDTIDVSYYNEVDISTRRGIFKLEDAEDGEVDDFYEEFSNPLQGWIISEDESSDITATSLIYNGIEREEWNKNERATNLPNEHPAGWNLIEMEQNNITEQAMRNYLLAKFTIPNNWARGISVLKKDDQPISRPTLLVPDSQYSREDSPILGSISPAGVASPPLQPASPTYSATSPAYMASSPAYSATSPAYSETSPAYSALKPESQQGGAIITDIKSHQDNNSVLIAIPFQNKNVDNTQDLKDLHKYIKSLREALNEYIHEQEDISHMNYKIVVLSHNMDIMSGIQILDSGLSDLKSSLNPISKLLVDNGSLKENIYKTHFNKGALFNIAGNIAIRDSTIRTILLHPMGYLPNKSMITHYFDLPLSGVNLLSIEDEFHGPILLNKKIFYKNSFPNNLWSDYNTSESYQRLLKQNNVPIKRFMDINAYWVRKPILQNIDDYKRPNELVDRDFSYYQQNNILRNKWYRTKNIQVISNNSSLYTVELDYNAKPLSNIDNSFIMEKVNSYPDSSLSSDNQQNTIMRYLSIYLTKTLEKETRLVNKEGKFTDITLITNDDKLDMVNIILRIRLILSVYKPFLMTIYSKELSIIKFSDFTVTLDRNDNINIRFDYNESLKDVSELFVDINDILSKPTVTNTNATYKFMEVTDFDYDDIKYNLEQTLFNLKRHVIDSIKSEHLIRLEGIRKSTNLTKFIRLESIGDTDLLLDPSTDSIKYLNLDDQSITDKPKNTLLNELTNNEFFIVMKYKLTRLLDIDESGVIDVINPDYFNKYRKGAKVIVNDKIATIVNTGVTSIEVSLGNKNEIIHVNPDSPSHSAVILEDILLADIDIVTKSFKGIDFVILGKYINKSGKNMVVIKTTEEPFMKIVEYSEITESKINTKEKAESLISSKKSIHVEKIIVLKDKPISLGESPKSHASPKSPASKSFFSSELTQKDLTAHPSNLDTTKIIQIKEEKQDTDKKDSELQSNILDLLYKKEPLEQLLIKKTDEKELNKLIKYNDSKSTDYPVDRKTDTTDLHKKRLPLFCEALSKMKPIESVVIKDKRNLIYRLILKEFEIDDSLLNSTNANKLLTKISNPKFIKILFRAYDIVFFNRKYRRYSGITGCTSKICINDECFETKDHEGISESHNTILSININTERLLNIILELNKSDSINVKLFGNEADDIIKCIQLIFEQELIRSFINCFCLSLQQEQPEKTINSELFKVISLNLFGHDNTTQQILSNK